jgi:hypothetical protein
MRTLRLSVVVVITLLLAASAMGCMPSWQEDWDLETVYLPAVYVTGETKDSDIEDVLAWDASDPRLSGAVTVRERSKAYPPGRVGTGGEGPSAFVATKVYEVVNAGGRWSGTATGLHVGDPYVGMDTVLLRGEDAYDGLSAYLLYGWPDDDDHDYPTFRGLIFPDPMPVPPGVSEPLAEE